MKYWKEVLFFSVITAVYVAGVAPDMTWMSLGGDQPNYVIAAKYFSPAGLMGYPTYVMIGWLFERMPFNDFWNLGLLSALSTVATCLFIFLIVKLLVGPPSLVSIEGKMSEGMTFKKSELRDLQDRKATRSLAPYVGAATYAGAFIVWSQSVIPEVYTFTVLFAIAGLYFVLKKKYWTACGVFAVGLGTHPIIGFALLPCLGYIYFSRGKDLKFVGKLCGIGSLGILLYLQVYLRTIPTGNPFFIGSPGSVLLNSSGGWLGLSVVPIDPTLTRSWELITMVVASFGFAIPLLFLLKRSRELSLLVTIGVLSFIWHATALYPQWITYLVLPTAVVAVLAGMGVSRFPFRKFAPIFLVIPLFLLGYNLYGYDVGRSVDPSPTTARQFYIELDLLPDNAIIIHHLWGHPGVLAYYYCSENSDRINFIPWHPEVLQRSDYAKILADGGTFIPDLDWEEIEEDRSYGTGHFARDFQAANPDRRVYVTYLKERSPTMEFGLMSSGSYYPGLNDVPSSKRTYVR